MAGRPSEEVETLAAPGVLHIPLQSRRFNFTQLVVADGRRVRTGQPLAKDLASYSLPLVAPAAGTVQLGAVADHLTLEDVEFEPEEAGVAGGDSRAMSEGMRRYKLFALGAWRFARDAHTSALPDPFGMPAAVVVSTERSERFVADWRVLLQGRLPEFVRGLEHLKALSRGQQIFVAVPKERSEAAAGLRDAIRESSCAEAVPVPRKYPLGDLRVLARALGLKKRPDSPVWGFDVAGVLAIDDAVTHSRPSVTSIISVAGPGAVDPRHVKAAVGHPLEGIIGSDLARGPCRVIDGGALSGAALPPEKVGLDIECQGLTLVPEHTKREFLGFMRPGFFRGSYSRVFLSSLRPGFAERLTTGVRGERRPCVSCGFCEEVCPAGIMPHLIHKYLFKDDIDGAEKMRIDLCLECGLCSYVCPAKLELRQQFIEAKEQMRQEMHAEEVTA
ncbi:MAG: 4Fe-4S dicluster domain-containing protein [Planctomycetota bacterium]|jgi:Na+-transporting NADH:ubiquinone oxidoreductase subunit A